MRGVGLVLVVLVAGCSVRADNPVAAAPAPAVTSTTAAPTSTSTTTTLPSPTTTTVPPATEVPAMAGDLPSLAAQLGAAEATIRAGTGDVAAAARTEQVIYRRVADHPDWDAPVLAALPAEYQDSVTRNLAARREFRGMVRKVSDQLPAWRIVDPIPADELLGYYKAAEAEFGVPWEYLAAVNLVESGMGRIQGLSTAGAQGPMQFLPATWAAYGGGGDIDDPHDAIFGAARYLTANGFAAGNVDGALFRYNNHPNYVRGVEDYAAEMTANPAAFAGYYAWQVYYFTTAGDILLPTGYESATPIPVADYAAAYPTRVLAY
jgi:membrane-bound lytic murein transglycosylase B